MRRMTRLGASVILVLGFAATIASNAGGAQAASSGCGQPLMLGQNNDCVGSTSLTDNSLWIYAGGDPGLDVEGSWTAVRGVSASSEGAGVEGDNSTGGPGIYGWVDTGASGVWGRNDSNRGGYGVSGFAAHGVGVYANGGNDGVYAETTAGNGAAVFGTNTGGGNGLWGQVTNAVSGVFGQNLGSGAGVTGQADGGIGVYAISSGGVALSVVGAASFSRSGTVTVPVGTTRVVVTGVPVTASSLFFATVQGNAAKTWVRAAVMTSPTSFTVYLNKAAVAAVPVAWFVLN